MVALVGGILELAGLVVLVLHVNRSLDASLAELLLDKGQEGACWLVLLQSCGQVLQVLAAHELVLAGDVAMHVLLQYFGAELQ